MITPTRFTINYRGQYGYGVSIPDWDGGEVVLASDYDAASTLIADLTDQLNRLRVEHESAQSLLRDIIHDDQITLSPSQLGWARAITQPKQTPPAAS